MGLIKTNKLFDTLKNLRLVEALGAAIPKKVPPGPAAGLFAPKIVPPGLKPPEAPPPPTPLSPPGTLTKTQSYCHLKFIRNLLGGWIPHLLFGPLYLLLLPSANQRFKDEKSETMPLIFQSSVKSGKKRLGKLVIE